MMKIALVLIISIISVSSEDVVPIYSHGYANIYYQGAEQGTPRYGVKFNLPARQQEASTQSAEVNEILKNCDRVNPELDPDTTTEQESEKFYPLATDPPPIKYNEALELTEEIPEDIEPTEPTVSNKQGTYYIYHPNGLLQKVLFTTKNDLQNKEYFAHFNYFDVPPIAEPIYTYDPQSLVFQKLHV